jgi:hypothetical protein
MKDKKKRIFFIIWTVGQIFFVAVLGLFWNKLIAHSDKLVPDLKWTDWLPIIIGLGESAVGWVDFVRLFNKPNLPENIQAKNLVIGTQNIYGDVTPNQVEESLLKAAREKLAELPVDRIPEPAVLPAGSHGPEFRSNPWFVGRDEKLKQLAILA